VSVHRADCANAAGLAGSQSGRLIEVEWDGERQGTWVVSIQIEALDRSKLLRDVAQVLAEHHVDIISCTTHTNPDRVATLHFDFELADPGHLDSILAAVKRVDSVYEVSRVLPGNRAAASH
jgi:guanosine-3',5'-bis(diphosphate) 3'-pyrophosphohydrolase